MGTERNLESNQSLAAIWERNVDTRLLPQRSTMRLNVLMSCTVFAICLCQGNGKASAQGLLVPITSNGNTHPKMCPLPSSTALSKLCKKGALH